MNKHARWLRHGAFLGGLLTLFACAPGAAPSAPTVEKAATQAVKAASPVATQAVASAPTVAAAASPVVGAASPVVATAVAASPIRITAAQLSPTDSTVTVQNNSSAAVDLSGWKIRVGSSTASLPANSRVGANESVTIHTASGTSAGRDIYLGQEAVALLGGLQPGASIALVDAQNAVVSEFILPRV